MRTLPLLATLVGAATLSAQNYGAGCGAAGNATFYEIFDEGTNFPVFDLNGTSIVMTPNWQGGYDVAVGSGTYMAPTSPSLGLGDDQLSGPLNLGAPFFYPGGSTTAVYMSSNGFLNLEFGGTQGCCNGTEAGLLSGPARIAPYWMDLNPNSTATTPSTHFEIVGACAYVTWVDVPEFGQTVGNTFQVCLQPTGVVEIIFQSMNGVATHDCLVGFSPGNGALSTPATDLSATLPFSSLPDANAMGLDAPSVCPPFGGTSIDLITTDIPAAAAVTVTALSFMKLNPGLPLPGAPGCEQYIGLGGAVVAVIGGGPTASYTLGLPGGAFYVGTSIKAQSACLVPGFNPFGVITSNGTEITVAAFPPIVSTQDFEGTTNGAGNYPVNWSDGGGSHMWSADSGGTPSSSTGPSAAVSGTQYMYCETSSSGGTGTFIMNSEVYANTGLSVLDMQMHRYGDSIGTLEVRVGDGTGTFPTVLASYTGDGGNVWSNELICFSETSANVQFQFHYTAGGSFRGDIALDDVSVR